MTASVAVGVILSLRWSSERWPRLVLDVLHRNLSMLALAVIAVHVLTSVADTFAPVTLKDAVIPFVSTYRPLWVGLGALAFDLLLAVALTSVARRRLGYRTWRAVHWAAYASWPLAIVHGFGTGTDTRVPWMLITSLACVAVVVAAVAWRIQAGWPAHAGVRMTAAAAVVAVPLGLLAWLPGGPLARGWARRAGTPPALLAAATRTNAGGGKARLPDAFSAQLSGTVDQAEVAQGLVSVDMPMTMSGGPGGSVDVHLIGAPLAGGGLSHPQGTVTAGPTSSPRLYSGRVTGLEGNRISAVVSAANRPSLALAIDVSIDQSGQSVSGSVNATRQ